MSNSKLTKKAVVVHSGGMDSSLCLALAIREFGADQVLSLSFTYGQRHAEEINRARKICGEWKTDHATLDISCLGQITENSLTRPWMKFEQRPGEPPNAMVVGRNGLMARIAGIHANHLGASSIALGVMELEGANSGYRDCSRTYMDKIQEALQIDFADPRFEIRTPVIAMTKAETMKLGLELGVLRFLLENTITCYRGVEKKGCEDCPACKLRNQGIQEFLKEYPDFEFSFRGAFNV